MRDRESPKHIPRVTDDFGEIPDAENGDDSSAGSNQPLCTFIPDIDVPVAPAVIEHNSIAQVRAR